MSHVNTNRVTQTGNLTADAELRSFPSGAKLVVFRIANNGFQGKANFFRVEFWGPRAEKIAQYLTSGRAVAIDGRLESEEWEAEDGAKRYGVKIVAENIELLGGRDDTQAKKPEPTRRTGTTGAAKGSRGGSKRRTSTAKGSRRSTTRGRK